MIGRRTLGKLGMVAFALGALTASGCTHMKEIRMENEKLAKLNANQQRIIFQKTQQATDLESKLAAMKKQLTGEQQLNAALDKRVKQQEDEVKRLASQLDAITHQGEKERQRVEAEIDRLTRSIKGVSWKKTTEGPVIVVGNKDLFNPGQAVLKKGSEVPLQKVANVLKKCKYQLRIDGHTDSDPIRKSGWESNHHLSVSRALSVFHFFRKAGIPESRMFVAGFGPNRPVADNKTEAGKRKNRRIEILLLPPSK